MTARTASPLPECRLCDRPTARSVWQANGELCSDCADGIAATVRMLPVRTAPPDPVDTVYVERWLPPVPGTGLRPVFEKDDQ